MDNSKWKALLQSIRSGEKLPKKNHLLILFLVGLLLFVAVFPFEENVRGCADSFSVMLVHIGTSGNSPVCNYHDERDIIFILYRIRALFGNIHEG